MKALIVIDVQNDFVTGALGTKQAVAILPNLKSKIDAGIAAGDEIIFTRDTHGANYADTNEGRHLPVPHCIKGTEGWQVVREIDRPDCVHIDKPTFGYTDWAALLGGREITEIDPNGENSGGSTKYSVTVTLPRTEDMLTGMNAAVRVQLRENDGRLLIPLAAVQEDANGIYVCTGYDKSSDEATDPIEITTGLSDGENVEVLSGLSEGDTVYYRYADTLEYSFVK